MNRYESTTYVTEDQYGQCLWMLSQIFDPAPKRWGSCDLRARLPVPNDYRAVWPEGTPMSERIAEWPRSEGATDE